MKRPRVAICGIHIESSTFTPYLSTAQDFTVLRGAQLLERYFWMSHDWARKVKWIPILRATALPGGVLEASAYHAWKLEILQGLTASLADGPLDGVFFDIHGAMSVEGMNDAEGDLITAIRDVVGPEPLISASMDLHGNVSHELFAGCDMLTCYRMAPHEDAEESCMRAAHNLYQRLESGAGKPVKALAHVPILLPGEKTSTRMEPAKGLYALIPEVEALDGVMDAAIWIGFAWADQPRCKGAVVVYGDDAEVIEEQTKRLAWAFWEAGPHFSFVAPTGTMQECLEHSLQAPRPFFISDSGDNPGAGGADDVTVALNHLLNWKPIREGTTSALHASIVDPAAAEICWKAGVGATVEVDLGGHIDTRDPGPQRIQGVVRALCDDPRGKRTAALQVDGLTVIVTSARNQYTQNEQFALLGLRTVDFDIVVIKIGYLEPDLFDAQADWMLAFTPGGVNQDLSHLEYKHIDRPMFPFDPEMILDSIDIEVVTV
ncbi:MAG: M81 family metallopeptidase [Actinomycetaceae bacterium]|nr:M81 family metallopeptidase [Actinomycetaceae bacterium]